MDILIVLIVLQGVIVVHELGHLAVARWYRVRVTAFTIGFGPTIARWHIRGISCRIGAVPFGGSLHTAAEEPTDAPHMNDCRLTDLSRGRRAWFHLGGVLANVLTATIAGTVYLAMVAPDIATARELSLLRIFARGRELPLSWIESFLVTAVGSITIVVGAPLLALWLILTLRAFTSGVERGNIAATIAFGSSILDHGVLGALDCFSTLSITIAAINIIPLFPLDGGKVVDDAIQRIPRPKLRTWCMTAHRNGGPIVFLGILAASLIGDVRWLFR